MTMHTQARAEAPGAFDRLFSFVSGFTLLFRRRKTLAMLEELDERLLKDIGLTRCQIRDMRRHW